MLSIIEILNIINEKNLNSEVNNYIFYDLKSDMLNAIVNYSKDRKVLMNNIKDEYDVVSDKKINVPLNLDDIEINQIFNETLKYININKNIKFERRIDFLKFKRLLLENQKMIQLILYGNKNLNLKEQRLLNELFIFDTNAFNIVLLLKDDNDFITYKTESGYILIDGKNYKKIKTYEK